MIAGWTAIIPLAQLVKVVIPAILWPESSAHLARLLHQFRMTIGSRICSLYDLIRIVQISYFTFFCVNHLILEPDIFYKPFFKYLPLL